MFTLQFQRTVCHANPSNTPSTLSPFHPSPAPAARAMEPTEPPDAAEPPPEPAEPDEHTDPESRSDSEQRGSRAECRSPSRRPAVKRRPGPPKRVKVETKQEKSGD